LDRIGRYLKRIEETCHHDTQKCPSHQGQTRSFFRILLEVRSKNSKSPVLVEKYPSEDTAKEALSALVSALNSGSQNNIVLSTGGGIAIAARDFEGASVKPSRAAVIM
jgi:hypothetical protein